MLLNNLEFKNNHKYFFPEDELDQQVLPDIFIHHLVIYNNNKALFSYLLVSYGCPNGWTKLANIF